MCIRDRWGSLCGSVDEAEGDLFALSNASTLGLSEEEILFHVRHLAEEIVMREQQARDALASEDRVRLEDRIDRALGLARQVRLLDNSEALALLSSIRLGVATGLVSTRHTLAETNQLLVAMQSAHVRAKMDTGSDELAVNTKRADLFRACFSTN